MMFFSLSNPSVFLRPVSAHYRNWSRKTLVSVAPELSENLLNSSLKKLKSCWLLLGLRSGRSIFGSLLALPGFLWGYPVGPVHVPRDDLGGGHRHSRLHLVPAGCGPLEVLVSALHADGGSDALPGHDDRDDGVVSVVFQSALLCSLLMRT